jgi:hypothetical protein
MSFPLQKKEKKKKERKKRKKKRKTNTCQNAHESLTFPRTTKSISFTEITGAASPETSSIQASLFRR